MTVTPRNHNVTIWMQLAIPPLSNDAAGDIYCAVFKPGYVPSSSDLVVNAAVKHSYTSAVAPTGHYVTIPSLVALREYQSYCYIEATGYFGVPFAAVLNSTRVFNTTCCKDISFANSPSYVFGDVFKYKNSAASKYVFNYALEAAPNAGSVTITPTFTFPNGTALAPSLLLAVPPTVTFTSSTPAFKLTSAGIFYLTASSRISGDLNIRLGVAGSTEYVSTSTTVTIMGSNDPLPAPQLLSAAFGGNGASFSVVFDAPTDQAGITASTWPCSQLFTFTGSNYTTCSWTDSGTVMGKFGTLDAAKAYLAPAQRLFMRGRLLRAACQVPGAPRCLLNLATNATTTTVSSPQIPLSPSIVFGMPAQIGGCTDLKMDLSASTGSGGRPWTSVVWTVTSSLGSALGVNAYVRTNYNNASNSVTVPRAQLAAVTYMITVSLTNFLGATATALKTLNVLEDNNMPSASIFGASTLTTKASTRLELTGTSKLSPCASSNIVSYVWAVYNSSGAMQVKLKSTSVDNRKFSLPAYSLKVLNSYKVSLTAKSMSSTGAVLSFNEYSVSVFVAHGDVVTAVKGGYSKRLPTDKSMVLDASISYDEDSAPGAVGAVPLNYTWSCSIASLVNFSQPCSFKSFLKPSKVLTLPSLTLTENFTYNFIVSAVSTDGRTSSRSVLVTAMAAGVPVVNIPSKRSKFNADSVLQLNGLFTANYSLYTSWHVSFAGSQLPLGSAAMTSVVKFFNQQQAINPNTVFPLSIAAHTFVAGRTYTFRLYAYSARALGINAYAEVFLNVNSPPSGGKVSVMPDNGFALSTSFLTMQAGWIDDLEDFPLSFDFLYGMSERVLAGQPSFISIVTSSPLASVASNLPSGLVSESYRIKLVGRAGDIYDAMGNASTYVTVTAGGNNSDPGAYLEDSLANSLASGDVDAAYQSINLVSAALAAVNCSVAPNCTALGRNGCGGTVNTCGGCLAGYGGVLGDGNTLCSSTVGVRAVGVLCKKNSVCVYNLCAGGVCQAPDKACLSTVQNMDCSGHGTCLFSDTSGTALYSCPVTNVFCAASCSCDEGYGGVSCSLNDAALTAREAARVNMCNAVLVTASVQTPSAKLLDLLVGTLYLAYDPNEVTSMRGIANCSQVLTKIGALASQGYMKGTQDSTPTEYADLITLFTSSVAATSTEDTTVASGRRLATSSVTKKKTVTVSKEEKSKAGAELSKNLAMATSGLTAGTLSTMVAGQAPKSVTSESGVKVQMQYTLTTELKSATLAPPTTAAESAYKVPQPKITVPGNGMAQCDSGGGYAKISTAGFGSNPHPDSSSVKSPLLQFGGNSAVPKAIPGKQVIKKAPPKPAPTPAYYITIQFLSPMKKLNYTAVNAFKRGLRPKVNFTLPACTTYNGEAYVPCKNCTISTFTLTNVTYGCYDMSQLCPTYVAMSKTSRRRLEGEGEEGSVVESSFEYDYDDAFDGIPRHMDNEREEMEEELEEHLWHPEWHEQLQLRRSLADATDDGINLNATDDGGATDDGILSTKAQSSVSEYGALLESLAAEVASTLTSNPFANFDLAAATPILSFCGALAGVILLGVCLLMKWDAVERAVALEARVDETKEIKKVVFANKLIESGKTGELMASVKQGGHGVVRLKHVGITPEPAPMSFLNRIGDSFRSSKVLAAAAEEERVDGDDAVLELEPMHQSDMMHEDGAVRLSVEAARKLAGHFASAVLRDESISFAEHFNGDRHVDLSDSFSMRTLIIVLQNHYMTHFWFGEASLSKSRTVRWLETCRGIMINVFIYTLFFVILYPPETACTAFVTKKTCTAQPSKFLASVTLCTWSPKSGCSVTPPPSSLTFSLMVTLICYIICIPIDILIGKVQEHWGMREPDFDKYKLSRFHKLANRYFGSCFLESKNFDVKLVSPLEAILKQAIANDDESRQYIGRATTKHDATASLEELELGCVDEYADMLTTREELQTILQSAQLFYRKLFSRSSSVNDILSKERISTVKAIQHHLMMNPNGTLTPLSWRQRVMYKDRQEMLEHKLSKAREGSLAVIDHVIGLPKNEAGSRDVALIHYFMLENVHWFYRISLRMNLFGFDCLPERIDPILWMGAWAFVSGALGFFLYWTFAWGIKNGSDRLGDWGLYFGLNMVQDIFFTQIVKVLILKVLAIIGLRPQLRAIRRVIMDAGMTVLQHSENIHDMRIVQHVSPACRAARSLDLYHLPAAAVLRSLDDHELEMCLENHFFDAGGVTLCLVVIPAVLAVVSTSYVTNLMDMFIYTSLNVFLIVTYVIFVVSVPLIIILSASLGGVTVYYYAFFAGAVRRASRLGTFIDGRGHVHTKRLFQTKGFDRYNPSFTRDLRHSLFYVIVAFVDLLSLVHVLFSLSERKNLADRRAADQQHSWASMNSLCGTGGTIMLPFDREIGGAEGAPASPTPVQALPMSAGGSGGAEPLSPVRRKKQVLHDALKDFPVEILAMQSTGATMNTEPETDHRIDQFNRYLFCSVDLLMPIKGEIMKGQDVVVDGRQAKVMLVNSSAATVDVQFVDNGGQRFHVPSSAVALRIARSISSAEFKKQSTTRSLQRNGSVLSPLSGEEQAPVIVVNGIVDTYASLYRDKTDSTTDSTLILNRMLVRHVFGPAAYDRSSMLFTLLDSIKPAEVYLKLSDALGLMEWARMAFYPGTRIISDNEMNEYNRRLQRWWHAKEVAWQVEKLRLSFATFSKWFVWCTKELLRDRAGFCSFDQESIEAFDREMHVKRTSGKAKRERAERAERAAASETRIASEPAKGGKRQPPGPPPPAMVNAGQRQWVEEEEESGEVEQLGAVVGVGEDGAGVEGAGGEGAGVRYKRVRAQPSPADVVLRRNIDELLEDLETTNDTSRPASAPLEKNTPESFLQAYLGRQIEVMEVDDDDDDDDLRSITDDQKAIRK